MLVARTTVFLETSCKSINNIKVTRIKKGARACEQIENVGIDHVSNTNIAW